MFKKKNWKRVDLVGEFVDILDNVEIEKLLIVSGDDDSENNEE